MSRPKRSTGGLVTDAATLTSNLVSEAAEKAVSYIPGGQEVTNAMKKTCAQLKEEVETYAKDLDAENVMLINMIKSFMTCNNCKLKFDDQTRMPYALTCQHSVCSACLVKNEEETDKEQVEYRNHVKTCANEFLDPKKEEVSDFKRRLDDLESEANVLQKAIEDHNLDNLKKQKIIKANEPLVGFFKEDNPAAKEAIKLAEATIEKNQEIIDKGTRKLQEKTGQINQLKATYQTKSRLVNLLLDNKTDHFFTYKCPICLLKIKAIPFSNFNEMNKIIKFHGLYEEEYFSQRLEKIKAFFSFKAKKNKKSKSPKKAKKSVKKNKKSAKKSVKKNKKSKSPKKAKKSVKKNKKSIRKAKKF